MRPERFLRGVIDYDTENVGWAWRVDARDNYAASMPTLSEHDARRDGWTNIGHDKDIVIDGKAYRLDWSNPDYVHDMRDLLEYLKTR
jgi:hypothetical protein